MNRRNFLKVTAFTVVTSAGSFWVYTKRLAEKAFNLAVISPIDRLTKIFTSYTGDNPTHAHKILWDKDSFIKSNPIPKPTQKVPLVIVGGGISGLSSAYLLREFNPIILEQAPRFGGNSKGERFENLDYSIGAAYFTKPDEGSILDIFIKDLGLDKLWSEKTEEDPVVMGGKIYKNFWSGETSPESPQFKILHQHFLDIYNGEKMPFPTIPIEDQTQKPYIDKLDSVSFKEYCEQIVGGKLHPHIETVLEHYCWSSFGGSFQNISAAQGLNFYAGEMGSILVLPGGNSKAAEVLLTKLTESLPQENLKVNSLVFDVQSTDKGVIVSYLDTTTQKVSSILADQVIMSCPKFVAKKLIPNLEPERLKAMNEIQYNAYLVANVCINANIPKTFYDLFLAGDGSPKDYTNLSEAVMTQKTTDVVYGNYYQEDPHRTVLSLYQALPFTGSRGMVYDPSSFVRFQEAFKQQVIKDVLPLFNLPESVISEVRVARWGHPLPVAATGKIKNGTCDLLRKPFNTHIHFIEQDNYLLPCLETAMTEALLLTPAIKTLLKK